MAKRYYVSGMVQGVGYRYFAARTARQLGIVGFAKNLRDGRVEVYAIAPHAALNSFRSELQRGPQGAIVENVSEDESEIDSQFADRFSIEYDD
jgi:acylphosphatase